MQKTGNFTIKKWAKVKILPSLLLLVALVAISAGKCNKRQAQPLNLMAADMVFETAADAEKRFADLLNDRDLGLAKIFKREKINILIPEKKWTGRLKDSGVSRQALFSVDNMRIKCAIKNKRQQRFRFSIYNPVGSKLFYRIYLEKQKKKKLLFNKFIEQKQFFKGNFDLDKSWQEFTIILETQGKGIGAWVNPQFVGKKDKPRIFIIIVLDTVRSDHTSLYGYFRKTTPTLERLALDSRVFRQAFSSSSWTLPAHVSLFSGKDLLGHQVLAPSDRIKEDYPLLAEVFQKNGFFTAAFTGGGFVDDHFGFHRGFQVYANSPGGVFLRNSAERILKNFINYAETFWGEDLFVFLHTYQAHAPYNFPTKFKKPFNQNLRRNSLGPGHFLKNKKTESFKPIAASNRQELVDMYDTAIFYLDQTLLAGVVQYLKEKGIYEQAGLVVTSDHGEEFYDHGSWGHGHSLYNEMVRIPLLIKYPENRHKGTDDTLTSIADIPALFLHGSEIEFDQAFFPDLHGEKKRVLPIALPASPIIKQIPTKVSFLDDQFHFIYNIIDRKALEFFVPQPQNLEVFEFYERKDEKETKNLAGSKSMAMKEFHILLANYMQRLRKLHGKKQKIDKKLLKELKSLGYLNN